MLNEHFHLCFSIDFQPELTSTRLKSEEIYRERVASDSLFAAPNSNSASNAASQHLTREDNSGSRIADDVFDNDDIFAAPPPLPKASASGKSKSKINQLFDDSDDSDDLFSTASSRTPKSSADFLTSSRDAKFKKNGLFDEDIDIFGSSDVSNVNLFSDVKVSASKEPQKVPVDDPSPPAYDLLDEKSLDTANIITPAEDKQQASVKSQVAKSRRGIFDDSDEDDDLFSASKSSDGLFSSKSSSFLDEPPELPTGKAQDKDIFSAANKGLFDEDSDGDVDLFGKRGDKSISRDTSSKSFDKPLDSETKGEERKISGVESRDESTFEKVVEKGNFSTGIMSRDVTSEASLEATEETREVSSAKKDPPKSLDLPSMSASSAESDSTTQVPRRAVSGKIQNLMGKMGNFKILSPTDTPPVMRKAEEKIDVNENLADKDTSDGACLSTSSSQHSSAAAGTLQVKIIIIKALQ